MIYVCMITAKTKLITILMAKNSWYYYPIYIHRAIWIDIICLA
nr:MAG TPA: hypothetical protein [Caudoviricetes sp.]